MKNKFIQLFLIAASTVIMTVSTAFAANYWGIENGEWRYFDKNNNIITDSWAKSGEDWYYVDYEGRMVTDAIIEDNNDYYYLDVNGAMVRNHWIQSENDWYYFGANGKAYVTKKGTITSSDLKEINGKKYVFDSEGKMLYGWIDANSVALAGEDDTEAWKNATYFAGDANDGAIKFGWCQISVENNDELKDYWFYFNPSTGKKTLSEKKVINGATYKFDTNDGHMLDKWVDVATASNLSYINPNGTLVKKGWIYAVPDEDYIPEDYENDEYSWWYADNAGKIVKNQIKLINGKRYVFDNMGRMLDGLVAFDGTDYINKVGDTKFIEMTGDDIKGLTYSDLYYFSDSVNDGSRKTGNVKIELEDEVYSFYFKNSGAAETGYVTKIKKFAYNGLILCANGFDGKYAGVNATYSNGYTLNSGDVYYGKNIAVGQILVNNNGSIVKNKTNINDGNDVYIFTGKNGEILYAGDKLKANKNGTIIINGKNYEVD